MSVTSLSKEEYLKKYLSGADSKDGIKKKKKKKKDKDKVPVKSIPNVRIIDNDIHIPSATEEAVITLDGDFGHEDMPVIASVQDDRDIEIQVREEFEKSGKWKTFDGGENIAQKKLINEVIKLEQSDIKDEPLDEDEMSEFLNPKKKKRKIKKEKPDREIKREEKSDSDASPPRNRRRHDSDASSPRRRHDSDASPPRRRHDSDASPPRINENSDASPPRKHRSDHDSDISVPRRGGKESDSDVSPPRKRSGANVDSDESPPRMAKTLDGKKAGLQNAKELKDELKKHREKEKKEMLGLSDEVSGRTAETKIRGRLAEAEAKKAAEKARKEVPEEIKEKYQTWNKGMTQVKAASARLEDNLYEMSKSLTRTVDDKDREDLLKDQLREDDPMAAYMAKKARKMAGPRKVMPQYQGPMPPPNRYGIQPGYRWDGVDRGNGFEKKLMTQGAAKKANEEEAMKWSVEEM